MKSLESRFWAKVQKTETCWLWTAARFRGGYGCIKDGEKLRLAHRVAYKLVKGEIPETLVVDHLCRVRECMNPDHMELVSLKENNLRGTGLAAENKRKKACKYGHEFSEGNTKYYQTRSGVGRACRACNAERARKKRSKGTKSN